MGVTIVLECMDRLDTKTPKAQERFESVTLTGRLFLFHSFPLEDLTDEKKLK